MELQLYPPGFPPVNSGVGCDDSHWCAALTIDSLECTVGFAVCNPQCEEPVNWAFISTDGVPAGPPSPQDQDAATYIQDRHTMLLNPGDTISIHMFDASVPGQRGDHAFEVVIYDFSTHQVGWMQASAANGFMNTSSTDCSGTPYNFQPGVNDFGGDAEYGTDQIATLGYPEFEGPVMRNRCGGGFGPHSRS